MLMEQKTSMVPLIGKVDLMKFNHHYDTNKSNTKDFIKNLSPSLIVQTSDSLPWKNGVDSEYVQLAQRTRN